MTNNPNPAEEKKRFLRMSASPHVHTPVTTRFLMLDVIIALLPALVWSIFTFGLGALWVTLVTVASCVIFEMLYCMLMKKPIPCGDLSAVVTGILLAFTLPANIPLWMPVVGAFFAIVIVKQLYGGIGKNVVNPALAARVFMFLSFSNNMTFGEDSGNLIVDAVSGATPLVSLQKGIMPMPDGAGSFGEALVKCFAGEIDGCIGEVSAALLLLGGIYLLCRRVITWHIPVAFIGTVALVTFLFPAGGIPGWQFMLYELTTGGLMLGAIFMATDYVTSPTTPLGRIIYGVGCGLITVFIRYFGYPEGVSFAILVMNLFALVLDRWTMPVKFGGKNNGTK